MNSETAPSPTGPHHVKIFISWSGERSKALAEALREWLPLVLHYAEPWLSESDIEAGERWGDAVAKELESSSFGIICVTRDNAEMPWVLFEAGALAKSLQDARVIPLLLDLDFRDITGPLAQFQAKKVGKSGLDEVIRSINRAAPEPEPEERTKSLFEALWPKFESQIETIPEEEASAKRARPQSEVLEELVSSVRSVESRLRDVVDSPVPASRRRHRRLHPMLMEELMQTVADDPRDPMALLIAASMVRDDIPWLYELALDAYRAAKDGSPEEAQQASRRLVRAAEMLMRGPFPPEELGVHPRELMMLVDTLQHTAALRAVPPTRKRPKPKPPPESATE